MYGRHDQTSIYIYTNIIYIYIILTINGNSNASRIFFLSLFFFCSFFSFFCRLCIIDLLCFRCFARHRRSKKSRVRHFVLVFFIFNRCTTFNLLFDISIWQVRQSNYLSLSLFLSLRVPPRHHQTKSQRVEQSKKKKNDCLYLYTIYVYYFSFKANTVKFNFENGEYNFFSFLRNKSSLQNVLFFFLRF